MKTKQADKGPRRWLGGFLGVPVRKSSFGDWLDLTGRIPENTDCIMVLVNSGGGLNAGYPKPIGFLKLPHQLYLHEMKELLEKQGENDATYFRNGTKWITVVPVRSSEYIDVWSATPPNKDYATGVS